MEKPNLKYIKELSGGDMAFQSKLIKVIQDEFPEEIDEYQNNMSVSAFAKAAEDVHKIKHKFGILNLIESYELAIKYEEMLKRRDASLQAKFDSILNNIKDFIKDL